MKDVQSISQSCIMQSVRAAARRLSSLYERELLPVDLTASQFSAMIAIANESEATVGDLAEPLGMDRTTLTRVLGPLTRRGLVSLVPREDDRRVKTVSLTAAGDELLKEAIPLWQRAQNKAANSLNLSGEELRRLLGGS